MESFMYAPVGVFAGGDNGDADSLSAPHCRQSIATRAPRGNRVNHRGCALTSVCVDTLPLALLLCTQRWQTFALGRRGGRIPIGPDMCIRRRGRKAFTKLPTSRSSLTLSRSILLSTSH